MADDPTALLSLHLPGVFRWAGAVARQLRRHDVAIEGKRSGVATTDALTLADLTVQELLIAALRDLGPEVRRCVVQAEEVSGDLGRFAREGDWVLGIDPIDGTKAYRDRTSDGYAVMLHARTAEDVRYSLVYLPEVGAEGAAAGAEGATPGAEGAWLEVRDHHIALVADDWTRPARAVLDAAPPLARPAPSRRILVSGFVNDGERAAAVSAAGLEGITGGDGDASLYPRIARGELGGVLFHTPNVYDFPVCLHLARTFGGDAVRAHDGRRVDFRAIWRDARANMLRLPGIVACAVDPKMVATLVEVARNWSPQRYEA